MPTPQITYIHQAAFEDGSFVTQNYSLRTQLCNSGDSFMTTFSNQQLCNVPVDEVASNPTDSDSVFTYSGTISTDSDSVFTYSGTISTDSDSVPPSIASFSTASFNIIAVNGNNDYTFDDSGTLNEQYYQLPTLQDPSFELPSGTTLTISKTLSGHPLVLVKCADDPDDSLCFNPVQTFTPNLGVGSVTATINSGETFRYYCASHPFAMGGYITAS